RLARRRRAKKRTPTTRPSGGNAIQNPSQETARKTPRTASAEATRGQSLSHNSACCVQESAQASLRRASSIAPRASGRSLDSGAALNAENLLRHRTIL